MKIEGKIKICRKYQSSDFDFQRTEKVGWGKLSWSNKVNDKYIYTNKSFTAFGDAIDIIENNLNKIFYIKGNIRSEEFEGKDGKIKKIEKIIIDQATVYENIQPEGESINKIKEFINEDVDISTLDDDIPF